MWTVISLFIGLLCTLIPPTYSHGGTDESNRKFSEYAPLSPLKGGYSGTVDRIVGGTPVEDPNEFPWIARLGYLVSPIPQIFNITYQIDYFCGGSLISKEWVLTAAHCLDKLPPPSFWHSYKARIGGVNINSNEDGAIVTDISEMIMHEKYDPETYNNDIGLTKLAEAVSITLHRPIHLPQSNTFTNIDGRLAVVAGYGRTKEGGKPSKILLQAEVPIVPLETCKKSNPSVNENNLCAGYEQGGTDTCQGDSGGPMIMEDDGRDGNNGTWYQIGITSYGEGCGRPGYPGVYTNVSAYLDWIEIHIDHD